MAGISSRDGRKMRNRWAMLGKVGLALMVFVWATVLLPFASNVLSGTIALPVTWQATLKQAANWLFQNPIILTMGAIILVLLTLVFFLLSRFHPPAEQVQADTAQVTIGTESAQQSERQVKGKPQADVELEKLYLRRVERLTETLRVTDVPVGLVAPGVPLDEVFIPLQFFPQRLPSDHPLSTEEYAHYHELLRRGLLNEKMERVLVEFEKTWEAHFKKSDKIGIAELWQQLSREYPVAVIQGYPGMGKSTLMARLALHLARLGMGETDTLLGQPLYQRHRWDPALVPILLLLKDYAIDLKKALNASGDLSIMEYLKRVIERTDVPGLFAFLQKRLAQGRCVVILDGLDEVSEIEMRRLVKQRIENFVFDRRDAARGSFNRFLITSRVAGYDVVAFGDYLHYTIAPLTPEQIKDFLPRWCRVSARRRVVTGGLVDREEAITREAGEMVRKLSEAMQTSQGVRTLAENPLLLTLLAVMQQNSIELPRRRVELYTKVVQMLLENRNIIKDLTPIPETQAIQRLGPIAFRMQESGSSFARQREVKEELQETVRHEEGGTDEEIAREIESFLNRVRERGGLFVIRTADYYGFFHRTFQEYFAARYMLNRIKGDKSDLNPWITKLVQNVRASDDLWREPFLLAVAYQSSEDETVAQAILTQLLEVAPGVSFKGRVHDLLLAAECVIEAKPLTIGKALERQIAQQLLQCYEQAQRKREFQHCSQIEDVIQRWLLSLPGEGFRPALLMVLGETVSSTQQVELQRATLTLLAMIAQELDSGPDGIFDLLVPPLLALTGLSAIGTYQPATDLSVPIDLNVADLALTALSFLGKRGPAGLLLGKVRLQCKEVPEHLRVLMSLSLRLGTLVTPAAVPMIEANYRRYEAAIKRWMELRDAYRVEQITTRDRETCLSIHEELLACAEEACYPTALHLLNIAQTLMGAPVEHWEQLCQDYLLEQLNTGLYVSYQEMALLWAALFPNQTSQDQLVSSISTHYKGEGTKRQRYAQRFIAALSNDLRDPSYLKNLSYLRYPRNLRSLRDLRELNALRDLRSLRDLKDLIYLKNLRELNYLSHMRNLGYLGYLSYLRDLTYVSYLSYMRNLGYLDYLRNRLLTTEIAEKALERLATINVPFSADVIEGTDLLAILMGRMLQVVEREEMGEAIEHETRQIAEVARKVLLATGVDDEVKEVALDVIRYLPVRSANEIALVLRLAEDAMDEGLQGACMLALEVAKPKDGDAWTVLENGRRSKVGEVRGVVERVLGSRGR